MQQPESLQPIPLNQVTNPSLTRDSKADYTGCTDAPERVLYINFGFFKYGTNDKTHGAAVILSFLLLLSIVVVFLVDSLWHPSEVAEKTTLWLGNAFLFVAGVAVGKGNGSDEK